MKAGALEPDTKIRMSRVNGDIIEATITDQGQLKLSTGELFNTPSSAARFVRNGISANGWRTWRIVANGRPLGSARITKYSQ
jgi:hypothetical protein